MVDCIEDNCLMLSTVGFGHNLSKCVDCVDTHNDGDCKEDNKVLAGMGKG